MNKKKNKSKPADRNRSSLEEKAKGQLPRKNEDFNTGSHTPSSLRNVGAGYDDTGLGNNTNAADDDEKNTDSAEIKKKRNRGKE